ncbi:hypothetical protein [Colwellia sp. E2M01]|uniref:hypothetical protein n=1 Tax=Colwellia sp. E2M01 TaxID=2841561 RepID=UPI001C09AAEB|nr:hypothetical protein [Colwellia sp. E2M01]MBU2871368.1 hypothetical protein [Colwellia sp. E2M01]
MPKVHLKSGNDKAVCNWPWGNEAANFMVIEKGEIECWLTTDLLKATCRNCINKYIKTGSLNADSQKTNDNGWLIKVKPKLPNSSGFDELYVVKKHKDKPSFSGCNSVTQAKIYKSEKTASDIADKINILDSFDIEIIKV